MGMKKAEKRAIKGLTAAAARLNSSRRGTDVGNVPQAKKRKERRGVQSNIIISITYYYGNALLKCSVPPFSIKHSPGSQSKRDVLYSKGF